MDNSYDMPSLESSSKLEDDWNRPLGDHGTCTYPDCNLKIMWKKRILWSDYKPERQMNLCKVHNLCAICGKVTDWDPALCLDCENDKIMSERKCIEPGCTRNKPQGAAKKQLSRCQDHNPCAKCGKTVVWKDLLCKDCDPENKCPFPNCTNFPAWKQSTETVEGSGLWLSFKQHDELIHCAKHNICAKCGKQTMWDDYLCHDCNGFA
jgi:hypothetical protein